VRVLHVIQELGTGGAERIVLTLADGSIALGDTVALAAADGPLAASFPGPRYDLPIVARRPQRLAAAAFAIARAVRHFRPDVVHVHNPAVALAAAMAWPLAGRPQMLTTIHGVTGADYGRLSRFARVLPGPLVACGPAVGAAMRAAGCRVDHIVINGVAPFLVPASADDTISRLTARAAVRAELGVRDDQRMLIVVGRLVEPKNQALAIRAVARLSEHVLVLAGSGTQREELERQAHSLGVADRVRFLGDRTDARVLLAVADVVVVPSRREGLSLAVLEALWSGTPIVATAVVGVRELLVDGRDALLVPDDDTDALVDALHRLATDSSLGVALAQKALAVAPEYGADRMVGAYQEMYEQLATGSGTTR
jgi:glycosyltransferase involved in cell wall biosynthesis